MLFRNFKHGMLNKETLIIKTIISFIFLFLLTSQIYAVPVIEITVKQRVIVAKERGIVTLPFTIFNRGDRALHLEETMDLPEGWRILATRGSFSLEAGERKLRLVHILASSDVPAGKHIIPYKVMAIGSPNIRSHKKITVVINSTPKLLVDIIEKPEIVLAGEEYSVKVQVKNKGNVPLSLKVDVEDRLSYITGFGPRHIKLKPSQKTIVTIKSSIPVSLKNSSTHTLKLSLRGKSLTIDKLINTSIVSFSPNGLGLYHKIPSKISMKFTSNDNKGVLQTEMIAAGYLDQKNTQYLKLVYRDTQTHKHSSLGSGSEKHVTYNNDTFDVNLGDQLFSLTGLIDEGLYGKGAEINYHPIEKDWSIRAFSAQQTLDDDYDINTTNIHGFEVGYRFTNSLELAVNTLFKNDDGNIQPNESMKGIQLYWDKYAAAEVKLSLAQDLKGRAFRLQQNGRINAFNYDFEIQKADAAFNGIIKDNKSESITGIFNFNNDKSYLRANIYQAKHNLDKDVTIPIEKEKVISLGIGHSFRNNQDSIFTEVFSRDTEWVIGNQTDLDQLSQGFRVNYQKEISSELGLNGAFQHSISDDKVKLKKSKRNTGSLTLAYTPSEKFNMGFNIESSQASNGRASSSSLELGYGLNATVRFTENQILSGYWRHSQGNIDNLQLNYNHTFNKGVTIGASVSTENISANNDLSYLFKISVPFDTPLYKYKNIGSLQGKVLTKDLNVPVSNTIIGIAGQYAVTDINGNYRFKAIKEGKYPLSTNLTKTNLNNFLIENEQQQTTIVNANKIKTHNITLAPGTGINGQVLSYTVSKGSILQNNNDELKPSSGVEGLLVILESPDNPEIEHKALTSEGGFFSFKGIKAGKWIIHITDPQGVIKNTRLEEPLRTLELKVGEEKDILFKAIPLVKRIIKVGPSNGFSVSGE